MDHLPALTVPAGSTVVFKITATNNAQAYGMDDTHTLIVNGQLIKTVAGTDANQNDLQWAISSLAAAGTYASSITTVSGGITQVTISH
jgi:hypothetical protein